MAAKKKMNKAIKPAMAMTEVGSSGRSNRLGMEFDATSDFILRLRGTKAIKVYREMADNDAVIGGILTAMDLMIRAADWRVEQAAAGGKEEAALKAVEFVESLLDDMSHTFEESISEILSFLPFGYSFMEVVYKRRLGPSQKDSSKRSKFSDGYIGIRKLAPRPQESITKFIYDDSGGIEAVVQRIESGDVTIPIEKGLLFRTVARNNSPMGRSVLRNAYVSYYRMSNIQGIEAIAIERELNGLPVGKIPSEYLAANADAGQVAFRNKIEQALRDVKNNEQGYVLLPSDTYANSSGDPTNVAMVSFELMSSSGTRAIDTGAVITRYQQDMARTVLADFIMLGSNERGSFSLSKSKTDLFLRALEAYINNIASVFNRHLLPRLWALNGFDNDVMPALVVGELAPVDLGELGTFIRDLAGAGAPLFPDDELNSALRAAANLPEPSEDAEMLGHNGGPALDDGNTGGNING